MRIRDFLDGPEAVAAVLAALGRTHPGALPYATGPAQAARMGLRVSDEVGGIAVGLLDADEQAAHVPAWMLDQRDELARDGWHGRRRVGPAAGVTERFSVILFAEHGSADEDGVITQWATVSVVRGYRN